MNCPTYNIALVDIFLQAMGEGFPGKVLCFDGCHRTWMAQGELFGRKDMKGIRLNNFKQKVSKMKKGNVKQAREITMLILSGLERFVNGKVVDSLAVYSHKEGSDKYTNLYRRLQRPYNHSENFFYEEDEAVLAYLIARWVVEGCEKEPVFDATPSPLPLLRLNGGCRLEFLTEEEKEEISWRKQAFRPEYYSALWDVVEHGTGNKTFYKWPIDELYKDKGCDKEKIDEIIKYVFGENYEDRSISSTFEKLEYESGVRRWTTFDKLFQNELKDEKLNGMLQDGNLLEKYQVFQSRMINAFVLENLRAILPREIGANLAIKVFKSLFRHVKGEPVDLKAEFLVPDHDRKTKEYKEAVENLIDESNYEELKRKLENLDKDCPATVFFKDFVKIINGHAHFYFRLSSDDVESMKDEARKNIRYLGDFHRYNFNSWENLREEFF